MWRLCFGEDDAAWDALIADGHPVTEADFALGISNIDEATVAWLKAGMVYEQGAEPIRKQLIAANFFYHTANRWPSWLMGVIHKSYLKMDKLVNEAANKRAEEAINDWEERQFFLKESWGPHGLTLNKYRLPGRPWGRLSLIPPDVACILITMPALASVVATEAQPLRAGGRGGGQVRRVARQVVVPTR